MVIRACARLAALLIFSALAGCFANPTAVPFLDHVLTVEQFAQAPAMRARVLAFCGNDPGRTMLDPNCINANQSARIASAGTGNFPKISTEIR